MKRLLIAALLVIGLSYKAHASTDVNVVFSSGTQNGICITTGTTIRVDNSWDGRLWGGSSTSAVLSARIGVELQNQTTGYNMWYGYNTAVSTTLGTGTSSQNGEVGFLLKPGDVKFVGANSTTAIFMQAADSAGNSCGPGGPWVHTENVFNAPTPQVQN